MPPDEKFDPANCPRGAVNETKIAYLEAIVENHAEHLNGHDEQLSDGREKFADFKGDLRVIKVVLFFIAFVAVTGGGGYALKMLLPFILH